jgi:hypothetical protein
MKISRVILILAAGIVVAGLALGSAARLGFIGAEARSTGLPASTNWMPASAELVGYLDIASVLASPLGAELESSDEGRERLHRLERFREFTGVDPRTDLEEVSFSTLGAPGAESGSWGVAVTGKLDPDKIVAHTEERVTLERSQHGGETVYVFPLGEKAGRSERTAMAFPKDATGLFGTPEHVKVMLDVGKGTRTSAAEGALLAQWSGETILKDTFWLLGSMKAGRALASQRSEKLALPPLQTFALSGRLDTDLKMTARGVADDPESATKLADMARGLVAMGSLQQQDGRPEIQALLDSVQIRAHENRVEILVAVPYETLRRLSREREKQPTPAPR